jgi:iron complex transport system substrate-binding protein
MRQLWLSALALLILACGGEPAPQAVSTPQRIIAIAPGVVEMLFELGLGDRVVGVGDYAKWPIQVAQKPQLGGLFNARLEAIAALRPDLAVLLPSEEKLAADLQQMGIEVLTVRSDTIGDVEEMAVLIAERCGVPEAGEAFLERWKSALAPRSTGREVRVLLSVTRESGRLADVLVAGPGTFLDELLSRLGITNVMADAGLAYPQVGLEEIIVRDPDVVVELQASPGDFEALRQDWSLLGAETPLADTCVQVLAGDHVLIPGPRLPRLYEELWQALLACSESASG